MSYEEDDVVCRFCNGKAYEGTGVFGAGGEEERVPCQGCYGTGRPIVITSIREWVTDENCQFHASDHCTVGMGTLARLAENEGRFICLECLSVLADIVLSKYSGPVPGWQCGPPTEQIW